MNIIFDYNRTLFDPETNTLYPGTKTLLKKLSAAHSLFLVSKKEPTRMKTIDTLGISKFFKKILFVGEKSKKLFTELGLQPENTLVIGDSLGSEIEAGNSFGATTVRIKQGVFKSALPSKKTQIPNYEISSLNEIESIIQKYV